MEQLRKPGEGSPAEKRRILVADDEETLRLGISYTLADADTEVETTEDGTKALALLSGAPFDLLILDLRMPGIDGITVIEAIRLSGNRVPVILCSAEFTPGTFLRAIRSNVVDFLLKPANPEQIRSAVDFVLEPPTTALGKAMSAARSGDTESTIHLLEAEADPVCTGWLKIFRSLLEDAATDEVETTEREFTALALNAGVPA